MQSIRMSTEIFALASEYYTILMLLAGGVLIGVALEQMRSAMRRSAWRERAPSRGLPTDAADQLRIVMRSDFVSQPLLNRSEARLFRELDRFVLERNPSWQVMAQVSLGEILRCKDAEAYRCVNSKRVDLLLVDDDCQPRHAVEYQGGGHFQGTAAARDAVKREALRRAGISYHEVIAGRTTPSELRRLIDKLVDRPAVTSDVVSTSASIRPARTGTA